MSIYMQQVNVEEFGAIGDGNTNNSKAFQDAIDHLDSIGGGVLYIPNYGNSIYVLNSSPYIKDNIHVLSNRAILKKDGNSTDYRVFSSASNGSQGYGSGASNIIFEGLVISGDFSIHEGASITLHHSQQVVFRNCVFREAIGTGHAIDLGGCDAVIVDNCRFEGFDIQTGREYAEAIQLDNSLAQGIAGDIKGSYDGIPTKNVTVQNCHFVPLEIDDKTYPAPNPLGSHNRVVGQLFTSICFINNFVSGGISTPDNPDFSSYSVGWLHFYHIDGLEISGNIFKNTTGDPARVLGLYTIDTAIPVNQASEEKPDMVPYPIEVPRNVKFNNNKLIGFNSIEKNNTMFLQGRNYDKVYYVKNVTIDYNDFIDCYNDTVTGNYGLDIVRAKYTEGLSISNNYCNSIKRLADLHGCQNINFNHNVMNNVQYYSLSSAESDSLQAFGNTHDGVAGGFYVASSDKAKVLNNTFTNLYPYATEVHPQMISLSSVNRLVINNNDISIDIPEVTNGINIYGMSTKGYVKNNIITGGAYEILIGDNTSEINT